APPEPDVGLPENGSRRMRWIMPLTLALIIMPAAWFAATGWLANQAHTPATGQLPQQLAGYSTVNQAGSDTDFQGGDQGVTHLSRRYADGRQSVQVDYAGIHVGQSGPEITNLRAWPFSNDKWQVVSKPVTVQADKQGPEFTALALAARHGSARRLLLYAYCIGPRWTTSLLQFKAWKTWYRLRGSPVPAGLIVVSSTAQTTPDKLADMASLAIRALRQSQS